MSERTRQDPLRVEEQDASFDSAPAPGRTFDEKAVAEILQRAAQLDRKKSAAVSELSLAELEQIARESGIDPAMVRRAIRERELGEERGSSRLAGAPMRKVFERVVDREVTVDEHERLVAELREFAGGPTRFQGQLVMPPQVSTVGRTLTFTGYVGRALLEVSIAPRNGKTVIRVRTDSSGVARGLFGGLVGGLGTNVAIWTGLAAALGLNLPVPASVAVGATAFLGALGGAYSLARALFSRNTRQLHLNIEKLADRLEATVSVGGPSR